MLNGHRSRILRILGLTAVVLSSGAGGKGSKSIYDATTKGWILCDRSPLPRSNIQADGLNPHKSGSYLVVHEQPHGDFVLDFDYRLSKGCNSGVFIRVSDLKNPVTTGIEVAIDDTQGKGFHDPGALYDLVAPVRNAQKPAGEWNHMQIKADGPKIEVLLNGSQVSSLNLDEWDTPGKRPDGSSHKFTNVAIGKLPRSGYIGFQDHGSNCWYKNIRIKELS